MNYTNNQVQIVLKNFTDIQKQDITKEVISKYLNLVIVKVQHFYNKNDQKELFDVFYSANDETKCRTLTPEQASEVILLIIQEMTGRYEKEFNIKF